MENYGKGGSIKDNEKYFDSLNVFYKPCEQLLHYFELQICTI